MEHDSADESHPLYDQELLPSAGTCQFCNCIRRLFTEAKVRIDLGYGWDGQETPCAAHDGLLAWLKGKFYERNRDLALDQHVHKISFVRRKGSTPKIYLLNQNINFLDQGTFSLLLTQTSNGSQSSSCQSSFDPDWVDLQAARRWLGNCVKNHGSKCQDTLGAFSRTPAYLIDTKHNCIVEGETGFKYVALSYRWSRPDISFRTNRCNLANLIVPGDLLKQINIPHTITHAMHVVRSLGERYLWVDSLCIICDDKKHCQEQLRIMGSIYACAKLTIVSADGDAWDGLYGIERLSQPRQLPNIFTWLEGTKLAVRDLPALSAMHSSYERGSTEQYFKRGWTFQEYILSRRRLIFGKRQIHWKCACAVIHEDRPNDTQHPDELCGLQASLNMSNIFAGVPDFREFGELANEYHMRDFTHPEDALPGILGLLDLLKLSFRGGFLCGLPVMRFDAALMWHCGLPPNPARNGYGAVAIQEARNLTVNQKSDLPAAILPSWSWVSWWGRDLRIMYEEQSYQLPRTILNSLSFGTRQYITTPITTWYSHDTPFSHEKWPISSFPERTENVVEQGWVAEPFDPAKHCWYSQEFRQNPDLGLKESGLKPPPDRLVYHHPDLPNRFFWHPFLKAAREQHDKQPEAFELQQRQYISCKTQRNWFHARRMTREADAGRHSYREAYTTIIWEVSFDAQIVVVDDSNRVCGWLQVPVEPSPHDFQDGPSRFVEIGAINLAFEDAALAKKYPLSRSKIELVAICCRKSSIEDTWEKQFYGVLWVEWKDKVAYRRGCGFIEKGTWDRSGAEEVDLVLG